ncbi:MAG: zf-HC2 domain-containing protein [Melioribacteraceae bacterium]
MKHEKYKELLELNILGELNENEQIELENHLLECNECSEEYSQLKKMYSIIAKDSLEFPDERDLQNARIKLFNTINAEQNNQSFSEKVRNVFSEIFFKKYAIAFGSLALVLIGLLIGYLVFNKSDFKQNKFAKNEIDLDEIENLEITNVNLPQKFSSNYEFEFMNENGKQISYNGNLNDIVIQKLLAKAFKETENPGFKIKTANSVVEFMPENFKPDEKIKSAFINSIITDQNPGVRKTAIQALVNFPFDNEIRDVLLHTLGTDNNAANRMDAINILLEMNLKSNNVDSNIRTKLEERISKEDNEVIKLKTANFLRGGN